MNDEGYIYIGTPLFNKNHAASFSEGGIHVGLWCPENMFVYDTKDSRLGVLCKACPTTSTSSGGQSLGCTGCPGVPALTLDVHLIGCTPTCDTSAYVYDNSKNQCRYRGWSPGGYTPSNPSAGTSPQTYDNAGATLIALFLPCLLCTCCICFVCKSIARYRDQQDRMATSERGMDDKPETQADS